MSSTGRQKSTTRAAMPLKISDTLSGPHRSIMGFDRSTIRRLPSHFYLQFSLGVLLCVSVPLWLSASPQKPSMPVSKTPAEAKERFEEARRLLQGGYLENALGSVQQGLKIAPRSVEGLNLLGLIYLQ